MLEKIKCPEKVTNEEILERTEEKRTLVNNILHRKVNWIDHILRRNYLHNDVIEFKMTEVKGGEGRRSLILDYLRNIR